MDESKEQGPSGEGNGQSVDLAALKVIAEQLIGLAENLAAGRIRGDNPPISVPLRQRTNLTALAELARQAYSNRRLRAGVFGDESLFGEPAWDLLLDIFICDVEERPLSVTAACIGAVVPVSTALRWVITLEQKGLVTRINDSRDARRAFLHLTENGLAQMVAYFERVERVRPGPTLS